MESSKLKSKQKPEYFTNMLKEQRKKQFVSTFIRKLKQSIVRVEPVKHEMFSSEREQMSTLLNGIYIPRNV